MASIPGSHYNIFAGNQVVNFGVTTDPNNPPAPIPGDFNRFTVEEVQALVKGGGSGRVQR